MNEGRLNFDEKKNIEHPAEETTAHGIFNGPGGYAETNYATDDQAIDKKGLGQFSSDGKTEYALTHPDEFPIERRLREATTPEEYTKITADLEAFYVAQVEMLENDKPSTLADAEVVGFAQAVKESMDSKSKKNSKPVQEISTIADAAEYLRRPGIIEGLSDKARKFLAIAFSATAFAATAPAHAHGWGPMMGQYVAQRVTQEVQIGVQVNMQMGQLRNQCDLTIQSMENNMGLQMNNMQMQYGLNLNGIMLLHPDAVQQFQRNNPNPTPQQMAVFNQARQIAIQTNMQMRQMVMQCNMQMQQLSQGAAYSRTMRVIGDLPVLIIRR